MKGDFTRGIQPDRKRGKRYRRVLVQQSRVLLDSDAAALVDSFDHELRQVTADLGCQLGSPDYGYLITPGRLLALFERIDHVRTTLATTTAVRDYQRKYPEEPEGRYPSLRIDGVAPGSPPATPPGTVRIRILERLQGPLNAQVAIWYRADSPVNITVEAGTSSTALALPVATTWTRRVVPAVVTGTLQFVDITGDAAAPVWIALVELHEDRGPGPHFWAAAGRFHAKGLTPQLATATGYPEVSFPAADGFAASEPPFALPLPRPSIVAYLETWERDITAAEDPGIREVALGKVDTTVRTEVLGQVKWAVAGTATPRQLRDAFRSIAAPKSELVVSAPPAPPATDPCALPTSGGYTGADHRLYRFEVHASGFPMTALLKWSRDNAAHVFAVRAISASTVTLDRNSGLADGDLVEVLSEVVDLSDEDLATVIIGQVTPATRRSGMIARLKQEKSDGQGRDVFSLVDYSDPSLAVDPASDPMRFPTIAGELVPLRLRRWDDLVHAEDDGTQVTAKIEDGITITLSGEFRTGEYWQFEARRGATNHNGVPDTKPHGPERILAPLALLDFTAAPSEPLFLRAWLDDRFSSLCRLDADDIEFDGDRIGTDADTVQEVIEELYERDRGNCCDVTLGPNGSTGDDALRITQQLNATTFPRGGHLCLEPGVYDIHTPIVIDKDVVIRGCPEATLLAHGDIPIFEITATGRLRIEQLILYKGPSGTNTRLVELHGTGRLAAREVGFLGGESAIRMPDATVTQPDFNAANDPVLDPDNLPPREDAPAQIELRDCVVIASSGITATWLRSMIATRTAFVFANNGIGATRIDQLLVEDCAFRDGLTSTFFGSVDPSLVRAQTDELLDAVEPLPQGTGSSIAVIELLGGTVVRNTHRSMVAMWSRVARDLAIRDDELERTEGDAWGIRFHHARAVDVEGARYRARFAIEVPLSARRVQIRRCILDAVDGGITIAGENPELVNAGVITGVSIDGNQVTASLVGIAIAAKGTKAGVVDDVRIATNAIQVTGDGSSVVGIIAVGDSNPASAVILEANDITTTRVGIQTAGAGGVIRGNQIRLGHNGPAISAIGVTQLGQVAVIDNVIAGTNNSFTGIQLLDTPDVRVIGNQVRTTAEFDWLDHPGALSVRGTSNSLRHYVVGNDFAVGSVTINGAHNLHLVGNTMRYLTVDSGAAGQNGVIHGNQIGAIIIFIFAFSASLTGLRGIWKISDNLAPGAVQINGSTHQELLWWPGLFTDVMTFGFMREHMAGVAIDKRAKMVEVAGKMIGATKPPPDSSSSPKDLTLGRMKMARTTHELVDASVTIDDIRKGVEFEMLKPLRDFFFDHDVFLNFRTVIDPFDFHVSGNRFGLLVVAAANGGNAEESSTVHVVDNKVTLNCNVRLFSTGDNWLEAVVANNSASLYLPPALNAASTPNPILAPNLRR